VQTQGRVTFIREISTGRLCRQGRTWGYDYNQIWVDGGCRAEFRYGSGYYPGNGGGSSNDNSAAVAAGIIGALALGAVIAGQSQDAAPPPPAPAPYPPVSARPPAWATGTFRSFDSMSNQYVQLIIGSGGHVYLRSQEGSVMSEGQLYDGVIQWRNGRRSWLARESSGITMGDTESGQKYFFQRG
jgi:hypothetical protein